jgi:hypothetical protein
MVAKKTPAKKAVKAPAKKTPAKKAVKAPAKKTPAKKTPAVAEEQRKSPRKRRPRSASAAEKPAKQQKGGYGNDGEDTEERGESVGAHAAFVVSHFGGGAEATAEILDRAIEVWQRLPGAVVRGPAQIRPNRPAAPASGYDENQDPDL